MRIRAFGVLLLLVPALPYAASACGKLQPTLRDYYIQEHGDSYVKGLITLPSPEEGAKCEKARYDMRYWRCMYRDAQSSRPPRRTLETKGGVPIAVWRAQNTNPKKIAGGEAAKQRSIQRAWKYYREDAAREAEALPRVAAAKAGYLAARAKSKASGCKVGLYGRYGTYNDQSSDKLWLMATSRLAGVLVCKGERKRGWNRLPKSTRSPCTSALVFKVNAASYTGKRIYFS